MKDLGLTSLGAYVVSTNTKGKSEFGDLILDKAVNPDLQRVPLNKDEVIGGRFRVEKLIGWDELCLYYLCEDPGLNVWRIVREVFPFALDKDGKPTQTRGENGIIEPQGRTYDDARFKVKRQQQQLATDETPFTEIIDRNTYYIDRSVPKDVMRLRELLAESNNVHTVCAFIKALLEYLCDLAKQDRLAGNINEHNFAVVMNEGNIDKVILLNEANTLKAVDGKAVFNEKAMYDENTAAPETVRSLLVYSSSDTYGAGMLLMGALMPRHTFQVARDLIRHNPQEPRLRIVTAEAARKIGLDQDISRRVLNHILVKATEYDRRLRYQTASEMLEDVKELVLSLENKTAPYEDGFVEMEYDPDVFETYVADGRKTVFIYGNEEADFAMKLENALRKEGINTIAMNYPSEEGIDHCTKMVENMAMKPLYQKIDEEKDEMQSRFNALNMYDCVIVRNFCSNDLTNCGMLQEKSFHHLLHELDTGLIFISPKSGRDNPAIYGVVDDDHKEVIYYEKGERMSIVSNNLTNLLRQADFYIMGDILGKRRLFRHTGYEDWEKEIVSRIKTAKATGRNCDKLYELLLALMSINGKSLVCREAIEFANHLFEKQDYETWNNLNQEIYRLIQDAQI